MVFFSQIKKALQDNAVVALNLLLPSQSTKTGYVLVTNGTNASWALQSKNFSASSLTDGASFTHSMESTKLSVEFYDGDGIRQYDIRWAPNGSNAIYVYLPALESGTNTFTGEIFIQKRA